MASFFRNIDQIVAGREQPYGPCWHDMRGQCKFGDRCRHVHGTPREHVRVLDYVIRNHPKDWHLHLKVERYFFLLDREWVWNGREFALARNVLQGRKNLVETLKKPAGPNPWKPAPVGEVWKRVG